MVEIPDLTQLTNQIFSGLLTKLKPVLYILLILLIIYVLYKLIKLFFAWRKARREKITYENTGKILEIVERIERKIDGIIAKKEEKPIKEKKKKSKK